MCFRWKQAPSCKRGCIYIAVLLFWSNRCIYRQNCLLSSHLFSIRSSVQRNIIFHFWRLSNVSRQNICNLHSSSHRNPPLQKKSFQIIALSVIFWIYIYGRVKKKPDVSVDVTYHANPWNLSFIWTICRNRYRSLSVLGDNWMLWRNGLIEHNSLIRSQTAWILRLHQPDLLELVRISTRIKSLIAFQRLLLNFKRKILCAGDIVHTEGTFLWSESSCAHHSVCLIEGLIGWWLLRPTIKILAIQQLTFFTNIS